MNVARAKQIIDRLRAGRTGRSFCPCGCGTRPGHDDPTCARHRVLFVDRDYLDSPVFVAHRGGTRLTSLREQRKLRNALDDAGKE